MRRIGNVSVALGLAAVLFAVATAGAAAQTPSYATASETIRGTISVLSGKFAFTLADDRGFSDSVTFHDGTDIEPGGIALHAGEIVVITGHADGSTFVADAIDVDTGDTYDTSGAPSSNLGLYENGAIPAYVVPFGFGFGYGYGFAGGYYGYGYPAYPGYYVCCYGGGYQSPAGYHPGSSTVPVGSHSVPVPHTIRVHAPSAPPASSHTFSSGTRASSGTPQRR